jgi:hypothetical protein
MKTEKHTVEKEDTVAYRRSGVGSARDDRCVGVGMGGSPLFPVLTIIIPPCPRRDVLATNPRAYGRNADDLDAFRTSIMAPRGLNCWSGHVPQYDRYLLEGQKSTHACTQGASQLPHSMLTVSLTSNSLTLATCSAHTTSPTDTAISPYAVQLTPERFIKFVDSLSGSRDMLGLRRASPMAANS